MRLRRTAGLLAAVVVAALALAGCTTANSPEPGQSGGAITLKKPDSAPVPGERPAVTTEKPEGKLKIAIIAIENNPFFAQVKVGFEAAKEELAKVGAQVDWINAGTEVNVDNVGNAINAAAVDGYDAIAALMPGDGICNYVSQAVQQGILVAAYNGNAACAEKSGVAFFHGQDLKAAGKTAGELMCTATADLASEAKPGSVGVLTEAFAFQALEERRLGFLDGLKADCPWVTSAGDGVEYQGSTDRIASATRDYITSTPDLVGIYVTGGNPQVAAQTVAAANKTAQVKTIGFDFTDENVAEIKNGSMYAAIGQDPFGQSYDTIVWLYNALVTGVAPSPDYFIPTEAVVGTQENIDQVASSK